jgi:hypothetical protein
MTLITPGSGVSRGWARSRIAEGDIKAGACRYRLYPCGTGPYSRDRVRIHGLEG